MIQAPHSDSLFGKIYSCCITFCGTDPFLPIVSTGSVQMTSLTPSNDFIHSIIFKSSELFLKTTSACKSIVCSPIARHTVVTPEWESNSFPTAVVIPLLVETSRSALLQPSLSSFRLYANSKNSLSNLFLLRWTVVRGTSSLRDNASDDILPFEEI